MSFRGFPGFRGFLGFRASRALYSILAFPHAFPLFSLS